VVHVDRLLGELLEAHALASHPAYLIPSSSGDGAGPVTGSHERPIGLDVAVLDLALGEDQLAVLEQWERWVREVFGLVPYGVASGSRLEASQSHGTAEEVTLCGVVGFLRSYWPTWAQRTEPPPEEFAHEVRQLHSRALTALRMVEPKPWTFPCPADLPTGALCGYRLKVAHDGRDLAIHCPRCQTTWTLQRLVMVGRAAGTPQWVDAESAARALGCDVGHLGPMVRDGRLRTRGEKDHRRYDINSIGRDTPTGVGA
jgi:hypothetical protein